MIREMMMKMTLLAIRARRIDKNFIKDMDNECLVKGMFLIHNHILETIETGTEPSSAYAYAQVSINLFLDECDRRGMTDDDILKIIGADKEAPSDVINDILDTVKEMKGDDSPLIDFIKKNMRW